MTHTPQPARKLLVEKLCVAAEEAACMCGVSDRAWDWLVSEGRVPAPMVIGRDKRWSVKKLLAWKEKNAAGLVLPPDEAAPLTERAPGAKPSESENPGRIGYIYFVRPLEDGKAMKIGFTVDLPNRLADLQTSSPVLLHRVAALPLMRQRHERELHNIFGELRVRGEWFRYNERSQLGRFVDGCAKRTPTMQRASMALLENQALSRALIGICRCKSAADLFGRIGAMAAIGDTGVDDLLACISGGGAA